MLGYRRVTTKALDEPHLRRVFSNLACGRLPVIRAFFYPGKSVFAYSAENLTWALLSGVLNALGAWALFAALKSGGKASIVVPVTALYPLVVIALVPFILKESITTFQRRLISK
ncbi:EamA family transporter [Edaphobacter paludis]|uniref:EamA family transporter n=1 Tax=Edaphobacter paludis TaxID=3035702 RepID=UPI0035A0489D